LSGEIEDQSIREGWKGIDVTVTRAELFVVGL
jgi:hypothetical protein